MLSLYLNSFRTLLKSSANTMISSKVLSTAPPQKKSSPDLKNRMVWIDLELTGLDPNTDQIMEVACIVTDSDLNSVDAGVNIIIHTPEAILDNMNDWCKEHHGKSGLTDSCKESSISVTEAEDQILSYLSKNTAPGVCPLAGNTVYMDRIFLMKYMPRVHGHMHYRIIDVSSLKELCRLWAPETLQGAPRKPYTHRTMEDILSSIQELKYYKSNFLNVK